MKPHQLHKLLVHAFKNRRKVLATGEPGVGKSDIVEQAAKEAGCDLLVGHPAVSDPTDFKGMPAITGTKDKPEAHFLPFGDLNALIQAKQPTVYFLDDLGQAPHSVQAAVMQLILARRVNGHRIADCVTFCGATNDTSHKAGVHSLLEPVKSRWDTIVKLEPDMDSWCQWAMTNGMPAELVAFIRFRPELLNKFEPTKELTNSPSPRSVASVGRWVNEGITDVEVLKGAAGEGFTAEFLAFLRVWQNLPNIDALLMDPAKAPVPTDPATQYALISALARKSEVGNFGRVLTYLGRMPKEFEVCAVKDALHMKKELTQAHEFTDWAIRNASVLA